MRTQIINYLLVGNILAMVNPFYDLLFELALLTYNRLFSILSMIIEFISIFGLIILVVGLILINKKEEIDRKRGVITSLLIGIVIIAFSIFFPPLLGFLQIRFLLYPMLMIIFIQFIGVEFSVASLILFRKKKYGTKEPKLY